MDEWWTCSSKIGWVCGRGAMGWRRPLQRPDPWHCQDFTMEYYFWCFYVLNGKKSQHTLDQTGQWVLGPSLKRLHTWSLKVKWNFLFFVNIALFIKTWPMFVFLFAFFFFSLVEARTDGQTVKRQRNKRTWADGEKINTKQIKELPSIPLCTCFPLSTPVTQRQPLLPTFPYQFL